VFVWMRWREEGWEVRITVMPRDDLTGSGQRRPLRSNGRRSLHKTVTLSKSGSCMRAQGLSALCPHRRPNTRGCTTPTTSAPAPTTDRTGTLRTARLARACICTDLAYKVARVNVFSAVGFSKGRRNRETTGQFLFSFCLEKCVTTVLTRFCTSGIPSLLSRAETGLLHAIYIPNGLEAS